MSFSKFLAVAVLTSFLVVFSSRNAAGQSNAASAYFNSQYALSYALAGYNDFQNDPSGKFVGPFFPTVVNEAYACAYNAHYYAYYGLYVDEAYFSYAYGFAAASHDLWLNLYSSPFYKGRTNLNDYYAQYYSSLAASNMYDASFGQ